MLSLVVTSVFILVSHGPAGAADAATGSAAPVVPRSLLLRFLVEPGVLTLVDARSPEEFAAAHISGAINIAHDTSTDISALLPADADAPIVVYCKTGKRAARLRATLVERGYTNVGILRPGQVQWFDDMAVFNCGVDAVSTTPGNVLSLLNKGKSEVTE